MDRTEHLESLLAAVEPADVAAQDAETLALYIAQGGPMAELRIRGRLLSIEKEQGVTAEVMAPIWRAVGLEYGFVPPAVPSR